MFGERLKSARLAAGLTQQEIGDCINKDKRIVSRFESDYCLPNLQDLHKICEMLHTTPKKLQYPRVATAKTEVATAILANPRPDTYKLTVALNRGDFSLLTKENLKKAGYKNLQEFIKIAYNQLIKDLEKRSISNE